MAERRVAHDFSRVPLSNPVLGRGEPLRLGLRADMERSFVTSFDRVRVHRGPAAERMMDAHGAAAMTVGEDVLLGGDADRMVVAHELAHVIQQRRGGALPPAAHNAPHELDAAAAVRDVAAGRRAFVRATTGRGVARITPEERKRLIRERAAEAMRSEPVTKEMAAAAAEGAYMGQLESKGLRSYGLNKLAKDPNKNPNFPHLDISSKQGMIQIKARRNIDGATKEGQAAQDAYVQDVKDLIERREPGFYQPAVNKRDKAVAVISDKHQQIKAADAWPQRRGKDVSNDAKALEEHSIRTSALGVPDDHVKAARRAVREEARGNPTAFGLPANATSAQIRRMATQRVRGVGLTRKELDEMEAQYKATPEYKQREQEYKEEKVGRDKLKEKNKADVAQRKLDRAAAKAKKAEEAAKAAAEKEPAKKGKGGKVSPSGKKGGKGPTGGGSPAGGAAAVGTAATETAVARETSAADKPKKQKAGAKTSKTAAKPVPVAATKAATTVEAPVAQPETGGAPAVKAMAQTATQPKVVNKATVEQAHGGPALVEHAAAAPEAKPTPPAAKPAVTPPTGAPSKPVPPKTGQPPSTAKPRPSGKGPVPPPSGHQQEPPSSIHTEAHATRSVGATSDTRHGLGIGGEQGMDTKLKSDSGASLGTHVGVGGHWLVDVKPSDRQAGMVDLIVTVDFMVGGSASAGGHGLTITGGIEHGQSAQLRHTMSVEESQRYLAIMNAGGNGGTLPEHQLVRVGLSSGWSAAAEMWATMQHGPLAKGSSVTTTTVDTAHLGGEGEVNAGMASVQLGYGRSQSNEVNVTVTNQTGEQYELAATVKHIEGQHGSIGLTIEGTGASVGKSEHVSTGDSVYFTVPISDHAAYEAIRAAKTTEQLQALAKQYRAYLTGTAKHSGHDQSSTVGVKVLGAHASMGGTGAVDETVEHDPEGKKTGSTITASNTRGGKFGIGKYELGDEKREEFHGGVSEHGRADDGQLALGATKHEQSESALLPGFSKSKTASGPTLYFENAAYDRIVGEAHDEHTWWRHINPGTSRAGEWRALQNRLIRASTWLQDEGGGQGHWQYDATEVEAAIGSWTGGIAGDRLQAIEAIVHGTAGGGDLGTEASFPTDLAAYEQDFKQYVVVDAVRNSKAVKAVDEGQKAAVASPDEAEHTALPALAQTAIDELTEIKGKLDNLYKAVNDHESAFSDQATRANMLVRVGNARTAVANEIAAMRDVITPHVVVGKPPPEPAADGTPAPVQDAPAAPAQVDEAQKAAAETTAKENLDQMWVLSNGLWSTFARVETLINQGDFASTVNDINANLDRARNALKNLRAKRKANADAIHRFGLGDWLLGPDPDEVHGPHYDHLWNAVHSNSLEQPHL